METTKKGLRVVLTGATGLVGEGVLTVALEHPEVADVLVVGRRPSGRSHPKLEEVLVPDFLQLDSVVEQLKNVDACFFCAGISSAGMTEADYTHVTYTLTLHFANALLQQSPQASFCFVSGSHTDSSEQGRVMWARVKGKTENALLKLPFPRVVCFRPGFMKPIEGQKNVKRYYAAVSAISPLLGLFFPLCTMREVGLAMIHAALRGAPKPVLEVADLRALAAAEA